MKSMTRIVSGAIAIAAAAVPVGAASASSTVNLIGDTYHDRAGQHAYVDGAHCGVLAGDPVVATINGRRYLQAVGTVVCERASIESVSANFERLGTGTLAGSTSVASSAVAGPGDTSGSDRSSIVLRRLCRNYALNSYASQMSVDIRTDRGGREAIVFDFSRFNGRSCGV